MNERDWSALTEREWLLLESYARYMGIGESLAEREALVAGVVFGVQMAYGQLNDLEVLPHEYRN